MRAVFTCKWHTHRPGSRSSTATSHSSSSVQMEHCCRYFIAIGSILKSCCACDMLCMLKNNRHCSQIKHSTIACEQLSGSLSLRLTWTRRTGTTHQHTQQLVPPTACYCYCCSPATPGTLPAQLTTPRPQTAAAAALRCALFSDDLHHLVTCCKQESSCIL